MQFCSEINEPIIKRAIGISGFDGHAGRKDTPTETIIRGTTVKSVTQVVQRKKDSV